MFDSMYSFFHANNLLSKNQSGFRPGDSTINKLLSITNDIYESFEDYDYSVQSSLIYLKHSIKYGMRDLYLNLNKMRLVEIC